MLFDRTEAYSNSFPKGYYTVIVFIFYFKSLFFLLSFLSGAVVEAGQGQAGELRQVALWLQYDKYWSKSKKCYSLISSASALWQKIMEKMGIIISELQPHILGKSLFDVAGNIYPKFLDGCILISSASSSLTHKPL